MSDPSSCEPSPALQAAQAGQVSAENTADALRVSELQYRRLFEMARDGILILDSDQGRITDANPFMTELLGYSHGEMLGKQLWEIGLLEDKAASQEAFRCLKKDGYIRYEGLPLENQRGEQRQVEFISNLYRQNGHSVIQCNIRDITERKRVAAELTDAAMTVAQHERQTAVLEERTRLAREIHDTLAQGFTGITTQLEAAEAALLNAPEPVTPEALAAHRVQMDKVQERIGKARDLARESLAEARRSVTTLRSPLPEVAPLSEVLPQFLAEKLQDTATQTHFALEGVPYILPAGFEHCLLRVGQEAITNAADHAQAQKVAVTLSFAAGQMRLRVSDNGRGFNFKHSSVGHFGILGMTERAEKLGGKLTLVSRVGKGTEVDLTLPVSEEDFTEEPFTEEALKSESQKA